ncbi:testis-specific serine/threonine-protein kinase 1-like [Oppia nitens]|uniref:testis-specific serine/threonine-protein kinase 1-like n=1 Tax=Oppia nitens TaxID=1686743 RepID=UPI0023DBE63D|nr:testis-specific serine/threonine-protein kinase 1-like [Oppia nitens]
MATKDKNRDGMDILRRRGFTKFDPLDSGGQGNVYKTMKGKTVYAVKVVHIDDKDRNNHQLEEDLKRELAIIKNVRHVNCIRVEDLFRTQHKVFIVMEFMPNKSIGDEVDTKMAPLCEWKSKVYFTQIASAINYLHRHNIAHRDLKLDNVLLDIHYNAKVCDFGFSRFVVKDTTGRIRRSTSYVGTPSYEAPEVLMMRPYDPFKYDVWSLGICLFIMLNYDYPFNSDEDNQKVIDNQMKRKYQFNVNVNKKLSPLAKDLVKKLLEPNSDIRISIDNVCKHPWVPNCFHQLNNS